VPEQRNRDGSPDNVFHALLRLHKALLDNERVSYERVNGRIPSNGAFLQLVLNDSWFAWLRPLSQLMTTLDELNEEEDPSTVEDISALLASAQKLLMSTEEGEGFGRHYHDALQRSPDVVLEHAAVRALLRQSVPNKG
jgi:hypothetical protein